MTENSFVLLNGQTSHDRPAQFTYVGPNGKSIVDFVWCSNAWLRSISTFRVLNDVIYSDHFPTYLELKLNFANVETENFEYMNNATQVLRWNNCLANEFTLGMQLSSKVSILSDSIENMNTIFQETIVEISTQVGFFSRARGNQITYICNKPWFDKECFLLKKIVKSNLRICKENSFVEPFLSEYLNSKRQFKLTLRKKKKIYEINRLESFALCKNGTVF